VVLVISCADSIKEILSESGGVLSWGEVISRIYQRYPGKPWKESAIRAHLVGCSVNHASSRHYPTYPKFLYTVNTATVRLYDTNQDKKIPIENRVFKSSGGESRESEDELISASIRFENLLEEDVIQKLDKFRAGLKLYEKDGVSGRQFLVCSGNIDVLAEDDRGGLVVFEIKAGRAKMDILSDILSYIAGVKKEFPEKSVHGIIVAQDFDPGLRTAAMETHVIELVSYDLSFEYSIASLHTMRQYF
jgi:endonuclease